MKKAPSELAPPPKAFRRFVDRHPQLGEAWAITQKAGAEGPLDEPTQRLIKLGIAIGALREGAVHSAARKARALGLPEEALQQVVALAAGTLGFPATVAAFSWVEDDAPKE